MTSVSVSYNNIYLDREIQEGKYLADKGDPSVSLTELKEAERPLFIGLQKICMQEILYK